MHRSKMYLYPPASPARIVGDSISRLACAFQHAIQLRHQVTISIREVRPEKKCRWLPNRAKEDGGLTPGYDDDDALLRVRRGPAVITERR